MKRTRYSKSHVFAATITALSTLLIGCRMEGSHELTSPRPVPFSNIIVADEFWAPRIETNRTVTIPHDFRKCEETGRIDNFAKAGGSVKGKFEGIRFNDSDVFKVIEGAAYSLSTYPDPNLSEYLDSLITKIASAQENDGYLYTCRTIDPNNLPKDAGQTRWSYLISSHELYSVGHLYEAAVAHYRDTGKRTLLDVAIKNADLIDRTFGPGKKRDVPGHQEIEIGLVKLSRLTGNEKYLKLAKFFLDQRGRPEGHQLYGKNSQDHKPIVEQNEAVGHAVRAAYMYSAMGDVALLTGDQAYIQALDRLWEDVVSKKLYLTGGIGARGSGESFGSDYELPNKTAYCETCAAIANAMWNYRMFLLHRDAKYIDVLERVIYNGFLSGVSMKGDEFFYQNPLENAGDYQRSPWFDCACCPPNVARFIPSLPGYAYTQQNDDLYVNLFIGGNAIIRTNNNTVYLKQQTRYPWDGNVEITVEPTRSQEFAVYIRIPGWAQNRPVPSDLYRYLSEPASDGFGELGRDGKEVMLKVNGSSVSLDINNGYSRIRRKWEKGDVIELELPMPIQRVLSHQNVKDNLGKVALERGPVVYCFEGIDNPKGVANLVLPATAELNAEYHADLLGGIVTIKGKGKIQQSPSDEKMSLEDIEVVAIPYYAWAHRGKSQMTVWLPGSAEGETDSNQVESRTFFVAADGPFPTVEAACQAARKLSTGQPRKVIVQAGQYFFDKPLILGNEDAGLTIESAPGARVCLYGGRKITGWEKDGQNFYSAALPDVKERKWDFRALVVNGRFCKRARLPEKGFFEHQSSFDVPWMSTTGGGWKRKPTNEELTTLKYRSQDIGPWLDVNNAELTIYHMWDESMVGIAAMDTNSQSFIFANPSGHPPGAFGVKKYVIWNVREGMTEPGQWYLDRTNGKLIYWSLPQEDMTGAEVIAPTIESIIRIKGTKDTPARDITIRGLTLSVTTTPLKAGDFGAGKFDGAITVTSAESCRLLDLEISNAGGQGIKASGDRLRIERCHVHHTGACGIKFSGTDSVVTDSHIHDIGVTYPSAIGLWGGGKNSQISHNKVHDTPYTAINCGGENNRIEHNLIFRAMQELHDGAGIYITFCKGIVMRGNFIRDIIDTGGYGASAYYLDEQAEDCLVEGNLSIGVVRPSHNHMAKNNTIRNNVFISDTDASLTFPRSSNYIFEKNIIWAKGTISFDNREAITTFQNNILFSEKGKVESHKLADYSRAGTYLLQQDQTNLLADPLLAEFDKGKISFAPESPALKLGIKSIDVSGAGPRP